MGDPGCFCRGERERQERPEGEEDKARAPCFERVSALALHFNGFSLLALLVLPRATTRLVAVRKETFSVSSAAHLGKRYWSASPFPPTDSCWTSGNMFCFACVGNSTEFLSFCPVKGLTQPFTTFFLYDLRPVRQVLACLREPAVVS